MIGPTRRGTGTQLLWLLWALIVVGSGVLNGAQKTSVPADSPGRKASAASTEFPAARELYEEEAIPLAAPPLRVMETGPQCDASGNIYLVYSDSPQAVLNSPTAGSTLPIQRLSPDSKSVLAYQVEGIPDYDIAYRKSFAVDDRGTVYALLEAYHHKPDRDHPELPDYVIARFKDDGAVDSVVKLQRAIPRGRLDPNVMAAFRDGDFLVSGLTDSGPRTPHTGEFTGVFDRSGAFVAEVKLSDNARPQEGATAPSPGPSQPSKAQANESRGSASAPWWSSSIASGRFLSAPDGNIYVVRPSNPPQLYVVAPSGEVVGSLDVTPSDPSLQPDEMSLAGPDRLFIEFGHVATGHPGEDLQRRVLAVVDATTGQVTAVYRLPEGSHYLAACATPRNEFLFLGVTDAEKLEVVKFVGR
jgi:hypothetical protein